MSEQELEVQVESEANQYIPFSLDEVSLDFCMIGPNKNVPGEVDVLLAASRREKVQDRQGLAEAAGLKAVVMDIESFAARRAAGRLMEAMPGKGADALVALFEIGAQTTSMQVLRNEEVLYERDQAFGGAQLTQLIVRQYGFHWKRRRAKNAMASCRRTTRPWCCAPLSTAWRKNSAGPCNSFLPARPITVWITSCWQEGPHPCLV